MCLRFITFAGLNLEQYSSGTVTTFPLTSDTPFLESSSKVTLKFTGTGPNQERQEASHPHQVILHPEREELFVPDLGSDKTRRLTRNRSGVWESQGDVEYAPGSGPRHVAFYSMSCLFLRVNVTGQL